MILTFSLYSYGVVVMTPNVCFVVEITFCTVVTSIVIVPSLLKRYDNDKSALAALFVVDNDALIELSSSLTTSLNVCISVKGVPAILLFLSKS